MTSLRVLTISQHCLISSPSSTQLWTSLWWSPTWTLSGSHRLRCTAFCQLTITVPQHTSVLRGVPSRNARAPCVRAEQNSNCPYSRSILFKNERVKYSGLALAWGIKRWELCRNVLFSCRLALRGNLLWMNAVDEWWQRVGGLRFDSGRDTLTVSYTKAYSVFFSGHYFMLK